ncbi:MAG: cytochrome c biogenesis protein CcsA [Chitinophagaceae bacterium]|nr:cytochrome c biogenesis protein CcsA [Chitinophagaceae bacterium]
MDYIGEHRLPGQLGHFFIVLSLIASLVATVSYFLSARSKDEIDAGYWKKLARYAFITEAVSVFAVFGILFYIVHNHLFEYKYAWQHSSRSLEFKYILASLWEGQEGSFLLWSIWHCVLGLILIKTSKKWEAPVMSVVSFVQVFLATMIAGLYVFGEKIGTNPFILLRDSGVLDNAPALHANMDVTQPLLPDYLSAIKDGNGLNKLLQNYWMVIHPPVLFMGFASTIIPFAFTIAGLWKKQFGEWTKPALPWALFSAAVFGVGIMMGAKWAYESLTFGGYWAWDPVENASLVPWMVMVAGIHTLLIYKHSGHSLRATHLFFIISFALVLYSTFLTRSGILGETSVHAFTDLGMNVQLYLFLFAFLWLPAIAASKKFNGLMITLGTCIGLLVTTYVCDRTGFDLFNRPLAPILALITLLTGIGFAVYHIQTQVPSIKKEESGSSREFWMFIGALVFFLSAVVIIAQTSVPVYNEIFNMKKGAPEDSEYSYNRIQVFVAIIIGVLTAVTQYLKYKGTSTTYFLKKIWVPTLIAVVVATLILAFGKVNYEKKSVGFMAAIWVAVASSVYAIIANAAYIWLGLKGKLKLSGGSIAHLGFGMVLLGILITSSKKEVLSNNNSGIFVPLGGKEDPKENLTMLEGVKMDMGRYYITYLKDSFEARTEKTFFNIHFERKDGKENFLLRPYSYITEEGQQPNPDARHYWDHDVFTYITSTPKPDAIKDTATFKTNLLKPGDSLFYSKGLMIFQDVDTVNGLPDHIAAILGPEGKLYRASVKVFSKTGSIFTITPNLALAKTDMIAVPDTLTQEGLILQLRTVNPDKSVELAVKETDAVLKFVTLKAYKFPFIGLLWLGVIVTALGIIISMVRRIQLNRGKNKE